MSGQAVSLTLAVSSTNMTMVPPCTMTSRAALRQCGNRIVAHGDMACSTVSDYRIQAGSACGLNLMTSG